MSKKLTKVDSSMVHAVGYQVSLFGETARPCLRINNGIAPNQGGGL